MGSEEAALVVHVGLIDLGDKRSRLETLGDLLKKARGREKVNVERKAVRLPSALLYSRAAATM